MSWSTVLQDYAKLKDPESDLPPNVHLLDDQLTLTIHDGYEKAKYHFLIMPRDPFKLPSGSAVPSSHLNSLHSLLASPHAGAVLRALKTTADKVKALIKDEMFKSEGWSWTVNVGFHASESMKHVHLHVISGDLISEKLKKKQHYNSFHPTLGFFLHLDDVLEQVESGNVHIYDRPPSSYEALYKVPLRSFYTNEEFSNLPKLKVHLEQEWERQGKKQKRAADKVLLGKRKNDEGGNPDEKKAKT